LLNTATDAPTFKESLLQCMLNGICEPEKDDPDSFAKKIKYSIIWEEPEILKNVLENTGLDKAEKKDVLKEALIDAIARNNCDAVKALFGDPNASADQFDVEVRLHRKKDILELKAEKDHSEMQKYVENAGSWFELLSRMKQSKSNGMHVDVLKEKAKKQDEERLKKAIENKEDKKNQWNALEGDFDSTPEERLNFLVAKYEKRLLLLEGIYCDLLEDFSYHVGMLGPYVDLFFLNVLYNRVEMATYFWEKSSLSPVRTAITAAYMLREMAKTIGIEPAVKMSMLENAKHFETRAIGVMKAAQKTNRQLATQALDCPLRMFTDMTLLDVAVEGKCDAFVEECCREAIDARMYGDLDPYQNSLFWIFLNVFPLLGIWATFGAHLPFMEGATLGLEDVVFRPLVKFKLPPESDVLRGSTQRRVMPKGYPDRPHENDILKEKFDAPRCDAVRM